MTNAGPLRVLIVGAGIGGLTAAVAMRRAGHSVTVLEQTAVLGEVGAGLQVAPNASRILISLGLRPQLEETAARAEHSIRRRWQDGAILGTFPLGDAVEEHFGAPYLQMHRADLHRVLLKAAVEPGPGVPVEVQLDAIAVECTETADDAVVTLIDGRQFHGDLIVGADGVHSTLRPHVVGQEPPATFSGDIGYRALIDRAALAPNRAVDELFAKPSLTVWLGPQAHLVHYVIKSGSVVSLMAVIPGQEFEKESWSAVGDKEVLLQGFAGWDQRVLDLIRAADSVNSWALYDRPPIRQWTTSRVALLGDACHPMLPYQAQGAGQAIEDGAALGAATIGVTSASVPAALQQYERRRCDRASRVQAASRKNQYLFHMPDGADQIERDKLLASGGADYESYQWLWSPTTAA